MEGLPVGYRFHPTDDELVGYFLRNRASMGSEFRPSLIAECPDFYGKTEPWVIWECYGGEDEEALHLFAQRHRLHGNGNAKRFNRKVGSGTWSAQYSREVVQDCVVIGLKREFRYEGGSHSDQNNCWLMQEFEMGEKDVTVLCTLRQNAKRTSTSAKRKRNVAVQKKKHTSSTLDDDQNKAKMLRIEQPAATTSSETMVVNCSNSHSDDNAEFTRWLQVVLSEETSISSMGDVTLNASLLDESLGATASGLGFSCVDQHDIYSTLPSIIDPTLFDFTDNANADSVSPMQSHNSSIDVDSQALASYSSLLASPVNFDDILCDANQRDDAGSSQMQSMSSFVSDDNILCDATHNDNAGSSHAQSIAAIDSQDWSKQFEESYSDCIGELEFSFDDGDDHYLLQSRVVGDDQQVTIN